MRASTFKAMATAAFAVMAIVPAANAADMAPRYTKAPPVMLEVWNWTGFYIGGNAGYSWGRSRNDMTFFNTATGAVIVPPAGSITNGGFNMDGAVVGGQAGYNWQTSNWVLGVEADIQWTDERSRGNFSCAATLVGGACLPGLTFLPAGATGTNVAFDQKLEWFGTARVRAGFLATPKVLLYGTGGFAYGSIRTNAALAGFTPAGLAVAAVGSNTDTRFGWTVGAGAEFGLVQNWTAKIEYLYVDLSNSNFVVTGASNGYRFGLVRAGVNYHF